MTEERRQKLLQSSQGPGAEPFSQYNHMKVTDVDDGTATVELELQPDSLNCWGTPHGGLIGVEYGYLKAISTTKESMLYAMECFKKYGVLQG